MTVLESRPERYSAAVIGVGKAGEVSTSKQAGFRIGYTHAESYIRNERIDLVAGADINAGNLAAYQNTFGVSHGFADYEEMLRTVKPDIVSICTYVNLHREMIVAAAMSGVRGIICEKPFVAAPTDLKIVAEVAAETGVKIVVPHIRRYFPAFERAKELYVGGSVGQPLMCIAGIPDWDLSEWGSHWLDMFRFFHDDQPVKWVFGQMRVRDDRAFGHAIEEHGVAYFEFENGGKGLLDGGHAMNGDATMTLLGTEGALRVLGEDTVQIEDATGSRIESFSDRPDNTYPAVWDRLVQDLVLWLDGGTAPMLGLSNMLLSSELNLAAYLSAVRQDRIDLPLQDSTDEWPVEQLARGPRP